MSSRSSLGRLARILRMSSRNLVTVRTLVANCWRRVAMHDYSVLVWRGPDLSEVEGPLAQGVRLRVRAVRGRGARAARASARVERNEFSARSRHRSVRAYWCGSFAILENGGIRGHSPGSRRYSR